MSLVDMVLLSLQISLSLELKFFNVNEHIQMILSIKCFTCVMCVYVLNFFLSHLNVFFQQATTLYRKVYGLSRIESTVIVCIHAYWENGVFFVHLMILLLHFVFRNNLIFYSWNSSLTLKQSLIHRGELIEQTYMN